MPNPADICVIIAAFNAQATVGRAVASALAQPEASMVIVIDDASTDDTAAAARARDDGSGRLVVERLAVNAGPSHARNHAIARSTAPLVAILDADDFLLPGRLAALLAVPDWDLIADNIAFVDETRVGAIDTAAVAAHRTLPRLLSAADFVEGCISRADRYKGELGFLKPLVSRAFLDAHGLRYAEELRLAEDFDLYARALMAGARFRVAENCGYVAVERAGSLSTVHDVGDLERFEAAVSRLLPLAHGDPALVRELQRHHAQTARKRRHRAVLARKAALFEQPVHHMAGVLVDVARDKLRSWIGTGRREEPPPIRFLL